MDARLPNEENPPIQEFNYDMIRESQVNAVFDGKNLIMQRCPVSKCVEAYLDALQDHWSWLLQLKTDLKCAAENHQLQLFSEVEECQHHLKTINDKLNTTCSRHDASIDEGRHLMKEMEELHNDLEQCSKVVSALIERSEDIVPLKIQVPALPGPLMMTSMCNDKNHCMSITKDGHYGPHEIKFRVIGSEGTEGNAPNICFLIPSLNDEALDLIESLKNQLEATIVLQNAKEHELRRNMIFSIIKIVKSWDMKKFQSIEPVQCEEIIRIMNEEALKLLNDRESDDPSLKSLRDDLAYCNNLYIGLQRMLNQDETCTARKRHANKSIDLTCDGQSCSFGATEEQITGPAIPCHKCMAGKPVEPCQPLKKFKISKDLLSDRDESLPEITREMAATIEEKFQITDLQEIVSELNDIKVLRKDLETLRDHNWLNDEVVNFYLQLIVERSKQDRYPSVFAFYTYFFTNLQNRGHSAVTRWTRKIDIFGYDIILVPIHLVSHWCLGVIDFRKKEIKMFDSLLKNKDDSIRYLDILKNYLLSESEDKRKQFDFTGWSTNVMEDIPMQKNSDDCGMFVLKYAEYITRDGRMTFSQENMLYFRNLTAFEIITKTLKILNQ